MVIEGVPYHPYRITLAFKDGRRARWRRWCPGAPWIVETIDREIAARGIGPELRTVTIREEAK
jgi:hypothetical protein